VTVEEERLQAWIGDITDYFVRRGWPPITARTLAWLTVCDPPEQSPAQIAEAVQASRGSLTSTLRVLSTAGLIRSVSRAGDRSTYYRVAENAWANSWHEQLAGLKAFADLAGEGMDILGADSPRAARVRNAYELYRFLIDEAEPLWRRWEARRDDHEFSEPLE
jgi:DNA-binding transcriptional ArsR family regulator